MIHEYKEKISSVITLNNSSLEKIKELERNNQYLIEVNNKIEHRSSELERNLQFYMEKFESEEEDKLKFKSISEGNENRLKVLVSLIRNLYENEKFRCDKELEYMNKINVFFKESGGSGEYLGGSGSGNNTYNNSYRRDIRDRDRRIYNANDSLCAYDQNI
jgi:hypothetical protein